MSSSDRENKRQRIESESAEYIPHYTIENNDPIADNSELNTSSTPRMDPSRSLPEKASAAMEVDTVCVNISERPITDQMAVYLADPEAYRLDPDMIHRAFEAEETCLTHCVRHQNEKAVEGLIAQGADVNAPNVRDITPLAAAAHKGNVPIMRALLKAGALVDGLNSLGSTALIQASHFGHEEAVNLLLSADASSDLSNSKGTTALMRASQEGHLKITRQLIRAGSDVNRKNNEGMNALMLASQRGHDTIVAVLITAGAQPDVQTVQGSTALMLACKRGHAKVVETLVAHGAEIYVRDNRNRTAMDTAMRRMHVNLIPILNTQFQVKMMQQRENVARRKVIDRLRQGYNDRTLELNSEVKVALENLSSMPPRPAAGDGESYVSSAECSDKSRFPDTKGWTWPVTMMKIITMPQGVFEHIIDFIPPPRVWDSSLVRVINRAKLAPHQALLDVSAVIDDMLTDLRVFTDPVQSSLLVRLTRSPSAISYLRHELRVPPELVEMLTVWSDVQSLTTRISEAEVIFRTGFARHFISVAVQLFKWFRMAHSPTRMSDLLCNSSGGAAGMHTTDSADMALTRIMDVDDIITDAGGDDEEGEDDDQEENDFNSIAATTVVTSAPTIN